MPISFRRILRLALKEWRLLLRNPHGLAVLFLMPGVFVLVMSFTLKNTLIVHVDMPTVGWVLEDDGPAAAQWAREWIGRHGGARMESRQVLQAALRSREVEAGVVVRSPWLDEQGRPRSDQLEMWLGNRVQPAAAARLRAELLYAVVEAQAKIAAARAGAFASVMLGPTEDSVPITERAGPQVRYLYEIESGRPMTAVQQSVPAWLVFGMFFVVIPLAGVLIQERNEGTLVRLATFDVSPGVMLGGKLLAFMLVNWIQLVVMLLIGRWVVPAFGGDALHLELALEWFLPMVLAVSVAAVGMGLLVAARSRTFDHAATLGSGLNVVLGAIGGVMVPRMLMPPGLQTLSEWSPMGWALDGMQAVFLGDPDAAAILPRVALLAGFGLLCMLLSWPALQVRVRR